MGLAAVRLVALWHARVNSTAIVNGVPIAASVARGESAPWPKTLAEQLAAVRDLLLAETAFTTTGEVAKAFKGAKRNTVEEILASLAALGHVVRERGGGEVRWRATKDRLSSLAVQH